MFFRKRSSLPTIEKPKAGQLNLMGPDADELVYADNVFLKELFGDVPVATGIISTCDILFLYADLSETGRIQNCPLSLRELIRDSGAKIVVVASENPAANYVKAGQRQPFGQANLVMTLERRGAAFPRFFEQLFSRMKKSVSMPAAWVELCPQARDPRQANLPSTIFACEIGQLALGR
jgi:hypothetical protein